MDTGSPAWHTAAERPTGETVLRFIFLILILVGGALGFGSGWLAANIPGDEIGTWRMYDRDSGFVPAETSLAAPDAPVFVTVEITTAGPISRTEGRDFLRLTGSSDGETVLDAPLDFAGAEARTLNPQSGEIGYSQRAGSIETVSGDRYAFVLAASGDVPAQLLAATLKLDAGAYGHNPRLVLAGYALMGLGLIALFASLAAARRRRPRVEAPPPPPRWGRG